MAKPTLLSRSRREIAQLPVLLKTLYLFINSYNVILIVWTLFAVAYSARIQHRTAKAIFASEHPLSNSNHPNYPSIITHLLNALQRSPLVLTWVSLAAIEFSIANQQLPASITEDTINKPWRPIPSGRINTESAKVLRWTIFAIGLCYSFSVGGTYAFVTQTIIGFCYNDLRGSKNICLIRDILAATGLLSWLLGCTSVAAGPSSQYSVSELLTGISLIMAVFTTVAVQDFKDIEGDTASGRHTLQIMVGDNMARWVVASCLVVWSVVFTMFFSNSAVSLLPCVVGISLATSLMAIRTKSADTLYLEWWYLWIISLCVVVI